MTREFDPNAEVHRVLEALNALIESTDDRDVQEILEDAALELTTLLTVDEDLDDDLELRESA